MSKSLSTTHEPKAFPVSKESWIQLGLEKAGVTENELSRTVRDAFEENKRLLKANQIRLVKRDGQEEELVTPDNTARQKAITAIYDLAGLQKAKPQETVAKGDTFHFHLPDYYHKDFVEQGVIIDADPLKEESDGAT